MRFPATGAVLLAAQLMGAQPPQVIQQVDLSQITSFQPEDLPGVTFAFSPDEKWLAVTVTAHSPGRPFGEPGSAKLVLLPVNDPTETPVQIDPGLYPTGMLGWSPSSDAFFSQGMVPNLRDPHSEGVLKAWNLRGEEIFHLDGRSRHDVLSRGIFGFLDREHVLVRSSSAGGQPTRFETVDLHGRVVDTWTIPKHWQLRDISPDRRLLAVFSDEQASKTLIVDASSKKVVLSRDNPYDFWRSYGGIEEYFTEAGKTLCSVGSVGSLPERKDTITECWDVDSGKKIAQFGGFIGGAPAAASSHGSRLVLTNGLLFTRKNGESVLASYGERVVWDFRTGREIAVWGTPEFIWKNSPHGISSPGPMPVAISPAGHYVAEAIGSVLRIYELP